MPVAMKREGFYRILDNHIQSDFFNYFMGEGLKEKQKDISLSDEKLEEWLNRK